MKKTGLLLIFIMVAVFIGFGQNTPKTEEFKDGDYSRVKLTGLSDKSVETKLNAELKKYANGKIITAKNGSTTFHLEEIEIEYLKKYHFTYRTASGDFQQIKKKNGTLDSMMLNYKTSYSCKNLITGNDINFFDIFKKDAHPGMAALVKGKIKKDLFAFKCGKHEFTTEEINKILEYPLINEEGIRFQIEGCNDSKNCESTMEIFFLYEDLKQYLDPKGIIYKQ